MRLEGVQSFGVGVWMRVWMRSLDAVIGAGVEWVHYRQVGMLSCMACCKVYAVIIVGVDSDIRE